MALFGDAKLQSQYDTIHSQLQGSGAYTPITLPEQSLDSITEQLAQIYRPQIERAIAQRYGATKQQKAAIDVDAASRGMGTSTWVTDAKNRIMNAEAADVAGLESDYASQLAGDALTQYQNYLSDKLKLDQYNQQLRATMEGAAYDQAMQQYQLGMLEGTLPYQQMQLEYEHQQQMLPMELQQMQLQLELQQQQLDQAKKTASGSGGSGYDTNWIKEYIDALYDKTPRVQEVIQFPETSTSKKTSPIVIGTSTPSVASGNARNTAARLNMLKE